MRGLLGVARDAVQAERGRGGGEQRVAALMRPHRGMRGAAVEGHVDLAREQEPGRPRRQPAARQVAAEMAGEEAVDIVDHAGRDHRLGAAAAFLGGLEDQLHRARQAVAGSARRSATPRPIAVWPSWPQACMRPGRVER